MTGKNEGEIDAIYFVVINETNIFLMVLLLFMTKCHHLFAIYTKSLLRLRKGNKEKFQEPFKHCVAVQFLTYCQQYMLCYAI